MSSPHTSQWVVLQLAQAGQRARAQVQVQELVRVSVQVRARVQVRVRVVREGLLRRSCRCRSS